MIKFSGCLENLNIRRFQIDSVAKMSNWEKEKEKYLNMKSEEKQKNSIRLSEIPTWKRMCEMEKLPKPVPRMENCPIDANKNEKLAQKISIFEGDITKLAVILKLQICCSMECYYCRNPESKIVSDRCHCQRCEF